MLLKGAQVLRGTEYIFGRKNLPGSGEVKEVFHNWRNAINHSINLLYLTISNYIKTIQYPNYIKTMSTTLLKWTKAMS